MVQPIARLCIDLSLGLNANCALVTLFCLTLAVGYSWCPAYTLKYQMLEKIWFAGSLAASSLLQALLRTKSSQSTGANFPAHACGPITLLTCWSAGKAQGTNANFESTPPVRSFLFCLYSHWAKKLHWVRQGLAVRIGTVASQLLQCRCSSP